MKINKYNDLIFRRTKRKWVSILLNSFFGICSAVLIGYSVFRIKHEQLYQIETLLFSGIMLLIMGDFFNVLQAFQKESVFSKDKYEIFPVSEIKYFIRLYLLSMLSSRIFLYALPALTIISFTIGKSILSSLFVLILFLFLYVIKTFLVNLLYRVLNFYYCKFGDVLQKTIMVIFLSFSLGSSFFSSNTEIPEIPIDWLINFISFLVK